MGRLRRPGQSLGVLVLLPRRVRRRRCLAALDDRLGAAALVLCLVPLAAAGTRRLRDAGQSPWWLLFAIVPMGFVVLLTLMVMPGKAIEEVATPQNSR